MNYFKFKFHSNLHVICAFRLYFPLSSKIPSNADLIKVINFALQAPDIQSLVVSPDFPRCWLVTFVCNIFIYYGNFSATRKKDIFIKVKKLKCIRFFSTFSAPFGVFGKHTYNSNCNGISSRLSFSLRAPNWIVLTIQHSEFSTFFWTKTKQNFIVCIFNKANQTRWLSALTRPSPSWSMGGFHGSEGCSALWYLPLKAEVPNKYNNSSSSRSINIIY